MCVYLYSLGYGSIDRIFVNRRCQRIARIFGQVDASLGLPDITILGIHVHFQHNQYSPPPWSHNPTIYANDTQLYTTDIINVKSRLTLCCRNVFVTLVPKGGLPKPPLFSEQEGMF